MKLKINRTLIALRRLRNMSQQNIAEKLCVSRSTYIKIERGHSEISLSQFYSLSQILSVNLIEMMRMIDEENDRTGFTLPSIHSYYTQIIENLNANLALLQKVHSYNERK